MTISSNIVSTRSRDGRIARQEHQPGAVAALGRQGDPEPIGLLPQEPVGHLHQDARAVAGIHLASARAAMQQVDEQLQGLADDAVGSSGP